MARCRTLMIVAVPLAFGAVLNLGGCPPAAPPPAAEPAFVEFDATDSPVAFAWTDGQGETLAVLAERDAAGQPIRPTALTYLNADGTAWAVFVGDDGLIERIVSDGWIFALQNYTADTVDVVAISPDGTPTVYPAVGVIPEDLNTLRSFALSADASSKAILSEKQQTERLRPQRIFEWGSTILSVTGCVVGVAGASTGVGLALAGFGCGGALCSIADHVLDLGALRLICSGLTAVPCFVGQFLSFDCASLVLDFAALISPLFDGDYADPGMPPPVARDVWRPTVSIISPVSGDVITDSLIMVSGVADDPGTMSSGVVRVELRLNDGAWQTAEGTTNWNRPLILSQGANVIQARSHDGVGLESAPHTVWVTYDPDAVPPPDVSLPSPPVLIAPGTSSSPGATIDTLTPTMQWDAVSGAIGYSLHIYLWNSDQWILVYENDNLGIGTALALPPSTLQAGQRYRWNARAKNDHGWSESSAPLYFEMVDDPPPNDGGGVLELVADSWPIRINTHTGTAGSLPAWNSQGGPGMVRTINGPVRNIRITRIVSANNPACSIFDIASGDCGDGPPVSGPLCWFGEESEWPPPLSDYNEEACLGEGALDLDENQVAGFSIRISAKRDRFRRYSPYRIHFQGDGTNEVIGLFFYNVGTIVEY